MIVKFYNPETQQIVTHDELCVIYNASIPSTVEQFDTFYKLAYGKRPICDKFQYSKENNPVLIDDKWTITYTVLERDVEDCRRDMLVELNEKFEEKTKTAYLESSLGFPIDANDTANTNVEGLIKVMKSQGIESQYFCDYKNEYHLVTLPDLEVMQIEIIINAQSLYARKWGFRDKIYAATTTEELRNIDIIFD